MGAHGTFSASSDIFPCVREQRGTWRVEVTEAPAGCWKGKERAKVRDLDGARKTQPMCPSVAGNMCSTAGNISSYWKKYLPQIAFFF